MNVASPPKILFVDHSGMPGGGQLGLKRYLEKSSGINNSVLFYAGGPVLNSLADAGLQTHNLEAAQSTWSYFLKAKQLFGKLSTIRPNIVVVNSTKAATLLALIPKKFGAKWVYYLRDDLNPKRLSRLRLFYLSHFVLPRFDAFLANSQWTASTLPKQFSSRPLHIAYPVSGDSQQSAENSRTRFHGNQLRLVSLSRIAHWKGIHVLIEALEILADRGFGSRVKTVIAGSPLFEDQDFFDQLSLRSERVATTIEFAGHIFDVDDLLTESDILLNCSVTPEPFGQVIIQGLSRGLVVIGTDHGGPKEIIKSGVSGFLVPPNDAIGLADTLEYLLHNPSVLRPIAEQGVLEAERFGDEITVAQLDDALASLWAEWTKVNG